MRCHERTILVLLICYLTWRKSVAIDHVDPPADQQGPNGNGEEGAMGTDQIPNAEGGHDQLEDTHCEEAGDEAKATASINVDGKHQQEKSEQGPKIEEDENQERQEAGGGQNVLDEAVPLKKIKDQTKEDDFSIHRNHDVDSATGQISFVDMLSDNTDISNTDPGHTGGEGDGPMAHADSSPDSNQPPSAGAGGGGERQIKTQNEVEDTKDIRLKKEKQATATNEHKSENTAANAVPSPIVTSAPRPEPIIFTLEHVEPAANTSAMFTVTSSFSAGDTRCIKSERAKFIMRTINEINRLTQEMGIDQVGSPGLSDDDESLFVQASPEQVEEHLGNNFNFSRETSLSHVVYHNNNHTLIKVMLPTSSEVNNGVQQVAGNQPLIIEVTGYMPFLLYYSPVDGQLWLVFLTSFNNINRQFCESFVAEDYHCVMAEILNFYLHDVDGSAVPLLPDFLIVLSILFLISELIFSGPFRNMIRDMVCRHNLDSDDMKMKNYKTRPHSGDSEEITESNELPSQRNRERRIILLDLIRNIYHLNFNFAMFRQEDIHPESPGVIKDGAKFVTGQRESANGKTRRKTMPEQEHNATSNGARPKTKNSASKSPKTTDLPRQNGDTASSGSRQHQDERNQPPAPASSLTMEPESESRRDEFTLSQPDRTKDWSSKGARPKTKKSFGVDEEKGKK